MEVANFRYLLRKLTRPKSIVMDGFLVHVPTSLPHGVRKALYKETYELNERQLVRTALRPGDRVLELGSGIGVVSLLCARIVGPDNLLCYEANPRMAEIIASNFVVNGLEPKLINRAVSLRGGDVEFFRNENIVSSSLSSARGGEATNVPSDALNEVIERFRPTALVLDIEGAEVDLLTHADLSGIEKIIMEVHPKVVGTQATRKLLDHLEAVGFAVIADGNNGEVVFFSKPAPTS